MAQSIWISVPTDSPIMCTIRFDKGFPAKDQEKYPGAFLSIEPFFHGQIHRWPVIPGPGLFSDL